MTINFSASFNSIELPNLSGVGCMHIEFTLGLELNSKKAQKSVGEVVVDYKSGLVCTWSVEDTWRAVLKKQVSSQTIYCRMRMA